MTKKNEVSVVVNEQSLADLKAQFPTEQGFTKALLPRIEMASQDKMEGEGMEKHVATLAGAFFINKQGDEENEEGKKIWVKEELGNSIEGTIIYQRKQLRYYDEANQIYTSSPVYDTDDEVLPLWCDKKEVDKGTPAELKAREKYQVVKDGKTKSKLEENRILYVLYKGEMYQLNLRGTSMFAWLTYARNVLAPAVLTSFGSEAKEKGSIKWSQMTFKKVRDLNQDEVNNVLEKVKEIKDGLAMEKTHFAPTEKVDTLKNF